MSIIIRRIIVGLLATGLLMLSVVFIGGGIQWDRQQPPQLLATWGAKGTAPGQFNEPTGIAVTATEVFVSDARNARIQVFDRNGVFKRVIGRDVVARPMNLDVAGDKLYVADYFADVIHVFSLQGDHLQVLSPEDGLDSPGGVAARADGSVLIADTYGQRIVELAADGRLARSWSGQGAKAGQFSYPTDVALAADGSFYVADGYNDRIQQFDADGRFQRKWGGPFGMNIFGPFKGWFATVTSVAVGPDGQLVAADFYNDRLQVFSASGTFQSASSFDFSGPGHTEIAVDVDADGTIWSVNFAMHRVERRGLAR